MFVTLLFTLFSAVFLIIDSEGLAMIHSFIHFLDQFNPDPGVTGVRLSLNQTSSGEGYDCFDIL